MTYIYMRDEFESDLKKLEEADRSEKPKLPKTVILPKPECEKPLSVYPISYTKQVSVTETFDNSPKS